MGWGGGASESSQCSCVFVFSIRALPSAALCECCRSSGGRGVMVWGAGCSRLPEDLPPGLSLTSCPSPEGTLGNGRGRELGRPLSPHWSGSSWLGPMRALTLGGEASAFIWTDHHLLPPLCQSHPFPSLPSFGSLLWLCLWGQESLWASGFSAYIVEDAE